MKENKQVVAAMGTWLGTLAPWTWFATFTFSQLVSFARARYWFEQYLRLANNVIDHSRSNETHRRPNGFSYLEMDPSHIRKNIRAFRADELGHHNGRRHIHSLIADVESLLIDCGEKLPPTEWGRKCCWTHAWPCGYARILPYDPKLGAAYYVSKLLTNPLSEWDLYGFPQSATVREI